MTEPSASLTPRKLFDSSPSERYPAPSPRDHTRGKWSPQEDEILRSAVKKFKGKQWKQIAAMLPGRTDVQCLHRWQKVLRPGLMKGPWTKEEDNMVIQLVAKYGTKQWTEIAAELNTGRLGKQCRERWVNHLNPDLKKTEWTEQEDRILVSAHQIHGNQWAKIARLLNGRSDNAVKNRWNSALRRREQEFGALAIMSSQVDAPATSVAIGTKCESSSSRWSSGTPGSAKRPRDDESPTLPSSDEKIDLNQGCALHPRQPMEPPCSCIYRQRRLLSMTHDEDQQLPMTSATAHLAPDRRREDTHQAQAPGPDIQEAPSDSDFENRRLAQPHVFVAPSILRRAKFQRAPQLSIRD